MNTHTDSTVWLGDDVEVKVEYTNGCSWATVNGTLTIHTLNTGTGADDLNVLRTFFQQGLAAVMAHAQASLFETQP